MTENDQEAPDLVLDIEVLKSVVKEAVSEALAEFFVIEEEIELEDIHKMSIPEIIDLVASIDDKDTLRELYDAEKNHPQFTGGRGSVFDVIRARLEEL